MGWVGEMGRWGGGEGRNARFEVAIKMQRSAGEIMLNSVRDNSYPKLNILLETHSGRTIASVLEMPRYQVEAETRAEAIVALKNLLTVQLSQLEVIPLDFNSEQPNSLENPWLKFAGVFKDDPDFAEIVAELRQERQADFNDSEIDSSVYLSEL